jgi:hypothetical protein
LEREISALRYRVLQLEQGISCANTALLQAEREHVDTLKECSVVSGTR